MGLDGASGRGALHREPPLRARRRRAGWAPSARAARSRVIEPQGVQRPLRRVRAGVARWATILMAETRLGMASAASPRVPRMTRRVVCAIGVLAVMLAVLPGSASAATCSDYSNQA